ncbi:MAG: hypothetical protein IJV33_07385 [Bacteroidaceae bacterium]|nr:hypothetical protein [Bacteroidaceae bacterium]
MRKLILFLFLPMLIACSDDAVSGDDEKGDAQTPGLLLCKKTEDGKFILETSMPSSLSGITLVDSLDRGDFEPVQLIDDSLYRNDYFLLVRQDSCTYELEIFDNPPQVTGYNRYLIDFCSLTSPYYIYLVAFIYTNDKWEVWNEGPTILKAIEAIESKAI